MELFPPLFGICFSTIEPLRCGAAALDVLRFAPFLDAILSSLGRVVDVRNIVNETFNLFRMKVFTRK